MKKRFFAGILALCMLLTMLPMAAFAAEEPADDAQVSEIFYWAEKANIMAETGLAANNTAPYTISIEFDSAPASGTHYWAEVTFPAEEEKAAPTTVGIAWNGNGKSRFFSFSLTNQGQFEWWPEGLTPASANGDNLTLGDYTVKVYKVKEQPSSGLIQSPIKDETPIAEGTVNVTKTDSTPSDKLFIPANLTNFTETDITGGNATAGSYKLGQITVGDTSTTVPVLAENLKAHKNGADMYGYWVGVGIVQANDNDTFAVGWLNENGEIPSSPSYSIDSVSTMTKGNVTYKTFYWNAKDDTRTGYLSVKRNGSESPINYIIDFSGVTQMTYTPTISAIGFKADGAKANAAIDALNGEKPAPSDSERNTLYFKIEGLDPSATYNAVVTGGTGDKALTDTTNITGKESVIPYLSLKTWLGSTATPNGDHLEAGTYTVTLTKDGSETPVDTAEITLQPVTLDVNGGTGLAITQHEDKGDQFFYEVDAESNNVTFFADAKEMEDAEGNFANLVTIGTQPSKDKQTAVGWKYADGTFIAIYDSTELDLPSLDITVGHKSDLKEATTTTIGMDIDTLTVEGTTATTSGNTVKVAGELQKVESWEWFYGAENVAESVGYYLPLSIKKHVTSATAAITEAYTLMSDGTKKLLDFNSEVAGDVLIWHLAKDETTAFQNFKVYMAYAGSEDPVEYTIDVSQLFREGNTPTPTPAPPVIPPIVSTPTPAPTSEPTPAPSSEPTSNPTTEPTSQPSDKPTSTPTPTPGAVEIKPEVTVDENGVASAEVAGDQANQLVEAAKGDNVSNVTVKVEAPEDSAPITEATVALPGQAVEQLGSEANVDMTIDTPVGNVTLPGSSLSSLGKDAEKVTVTVAQKDDSTVAIEVKKDGQLVEKDLELKAELPASNNVSNTTVAVIVDKNGKETIVPKSVAENGKVTVLLKDGSATLKIKDNKKTFQDKIPSWAQDKVDFMASRELMVGNEKGLFAPDTKMNRAMLVQVLFSLESKPDTGVTDMFGDVKPGKWYTAAVSWGAQSGVIAGKPNGDFAPNENVTRETIAVILYAYAKHCGMDTTVNGSISGFGDASKVSGWAKNAMNWAIGAGVISGDGKNLNPKGEASRAEVATMITGFIKTMTK